MLAYNPFFNHYFFDLNPSPYKVSLTLLSLSSHVRFVRIMAKSFKYAEEHELIDFEQQVTSPLYVVDVLRCTYQLSTAERLLEVQDAIRSELPTHGPRMATPGKPRRRWATAT